MADSVDVPDRAKWRILRLPRTEGNPSRTSGPASRHGPLARSVLLTPLPAPVPAAAPAGWARSPIRSDRGSQLYRLLDQTNYRKLVDQLLSLLAALDCDVDLVVRARTA